MTNEERMAQGKFCFCQDDFICAFHRRGGYTTSQDTPCPPHDTEAMDMPHEVDGAIIYRCKKCGVREV